MPKIYVYTCGYIIHGKKVIIDGKEVTINPRQERYVLFSKTDPIRISIPQSTLNPIPENLLTDSDVLSLGPEHIDKSYAGVHQGPRYHGYIEFKDEFSSSPEVTLGKILGTYCELKKGSGLSESEENLKIEDLKIDQVFDALEQSQEPGVDKIRQSAGTADELKKLDAQIKAMRTFVTKAKQILIDSQNASGLFSGSKTVKINGKNVNLSKTNAAIYDIIKALENQYNLSYYGQTVEDADNTSLYPIFFDGEGEANSISSLEEIIEKSSKGMENAAKSKRKQVGLQSNYTESYEKMKELAEDTLNTINGSINQEVDTEARQQVPSSNNSSSFFSGSSSSSSSSSPSSSSSSSSSSSPSSSSSSSGDTPPSNSGPADSAPYTFC